MNVLIIGSGGREHALAWKIRQSRLCSRVYIAPGNAGTESVGENVPIGTMEFERLAAFAAEKKIDLVVVGPEAPLVEGIRDFFEADARYKSISIVGPGKSGAQLEGSKDFSKKFMMRHRIPTARAKTFDAKELVSAVDYLTTCKPPIVLKADGLAAGKGVVICLSKQEAVNVVRGMLVENRFGEAGSKVLVEEFLKGIELSVFVLTDGEHYVVLPEAKDYKRIGDGDTGPNTGGMGAVSPVHFADKVFIQKVEERIVKPTIAGMQKDGIAYKGFIFIGLMSVGGEPYVIEYNVRMGDPECQAVMPRIKSDFLELLKACANGKLQNASMEVEASCAVTTVIAADGYPGDVVKGSTIHGLDAGSEAIVFHAGTKKDGSRVVTNGGRVLAVTGLAPSMDEARRKAYEGISRIAWDGLYFRKDIGLDLMKLQN